MDMFVHNFAMSHLKYQISVYNPSASCLLVTPDAATPILPCRFCCQSLLAFFPLVTIQPGLALTIQTEGISQGAKIWKSHFFMK